MSLLIISTHLPPNVSINGDAKRDWQDKAAGDLVLDRISISKEDEARRHLNSAIINVRSKIWMSRALKIFPNLEYFYDVSPFPSCVVLEKRGRCIPQSQSLVMILAILTHCLNATAVDNYFVRAEGL